MIILIPDSDTDQELRDAHERAAYEALRRKHEAEYQAVMKLNPRNLRPEPRADGTRVLYVVLPSGPAELRYRPYPVPWGFITEGYGSDVRRTWGETELRAAVRHLLREPWETGLGGMS